MSLPHSIADILFALLAASAVLGQAMIVRAVLRSPRVIAGPGTAVVRRSRELAWTLVPAVALALTFAVAWRVMHRPAPAPAALTYTPS